MRAGLRLIRRPAYACGGRIERLICVPYGYPMPGWGIERGDYGFMTSDRERVVDKRNVALLYNSRGGNTKMVAEALRDALAQHGIEVEAREIAAAGLDGARSAIKPADVVLLGFWCDKGTCSEEVSALLPELSGKQVFLFGTAGFGGAPEYFERILAGVKAKLPEDATYLGGAMCQGKMGLAIRKRYEAMLAEKPDDQRVQAMIDNFDAAANHPDASDAQRIADAMLDALDIR